MKQYFILLFAFLSVGAMAERSVITINDNWQFTKDSVSDVAQLSDSHINWENINLPHTWNAEDAYVKKNYHRGTCWYKKEFSLPKTDVSASHFLKFEGVLSYAEVYLNGKLLGTHKGGYSAFVFDISNIAKLDQKNSLWVKVNNENRDIPPLMGDFTMWGGIYRDVRVVTVDQLHFAYGEFGHNGILIQTPVVSQAKATVKATVDVKNDLSTASKIAVKCVLRDNDQKIVASQSLTVTIAGGEKKRLIFEKLSVANPDLWSPDAPTLYSIETEIVNTKTNHVTDRLLNNIGFRWFSVDANKGFFLNGKHLKLVGVNRHQDFDGLGSALTDEFHRRDMQLVKEMGANFIRIAHYPQDDAVLDACDKLGIIAWEEIPIIETVLLDENFELLCKTNFKEMIYQHFNHSSVVLWGLMNESIWGTIRLYPEDKREPYLRRTHLFAKELDSISKAIDPQRLTTIAHHGDRPAYEKCGLSSVTDVVGWNVYNGWYGGDTKGFAETVDAEHSEHPERILMVSEYGAGSDKRLQTLRGQSFDFSIEYQQQYHEAILPYILERDFLAATAVWNMNDFGSANRDESMPRINNKGLMYYNREPKDVYYYYQAMLTKKPVLHIATRDWFMKTLVAESPTNTVMYPVKVYSNLKSIELFVNGQSYGKMTPENGHAIWMIPLKNGVNTLIARGDMNREDATTVDIKVIPFDLKSSKNNLLEIALNCGSNCDFTDDKSKMSWIADRPYTQGSFGYIGGDCYKPNDYKIGFNNQVYGTRNVPLFQTIRLGASGYKFDVPDGDYEVELDFAEPPTDNQTIIPAENIFDVFINNQLILPKWNIAENGGRCFAISKKVIVTASGQEGIHIELKAIKGTTLINGLKICRIE
ncbi:MAG: glycoside hydrolase family 2 TIM barrel-domain containing protein [Bacteroidales bacterium]|nr:glycoside hydrolase family 2 TIM barrel-domain containing protein [Bacteroidales bacterium]